MSDWTRWNLQTWNQRLLSHFFRSNDERPHPVVVLLVTADELARVTADAGANGEAVRDAFIDAVRRGIRHRKSLLEDATDYEGWPNPPRRVSSPRFVAHLLFTCIAASESSDELGDEASFISRLRALTDDQLPENSLQHLPLLWEYLRDWLAENEGQYRPLLLPNPGGFTRIGYTVNLTFPDRRDQRQLSELLDRAGLAGHEPPVARVLSLVASERGSFRRSFLQAFDEFRSQFGAAFGHAAPKLVDHRFWAAVREASLRGRGEAAIPDAVVRLTLLAVEEEDRLALFAAADQRSESTDLGFAQLHVPYGPWRFALVPRSSETLDSLGLERIVQAILDRSLRLPKLTSYVDQGLLPFVTGTHGLLELAPTEQLGEASVALVGKEIIDDLLRVFADGKATTRPSLYDGWVQVHDLPLQTRPSKELEATTLSRTWILHESLSPTSIRLRGGVRTDDGWLGVREVLPRVVVRGSSAITITGAHGTLALNRVGDDTWSFPNQDFTGEFTLVVSLAGSEDRRRIRFYAAPANEAFKTPSDPDAWIVEECSGTGTLSRSVPFASDPTHDDCSPLCDRAAYLGSNVGAFVSAGDDAAWRITRFGGTLIGERATLRGEAALPSCWIASANARRRWRKLLFESKPSPSDPEFDEARRRTRARAFGDAQLARLDAQQLIPDLLPMRLVSPAGAVDRLVRIIAGRAASRSGIDWREWSELAQRILGIGPTFLERLTRAWMEAGLVDVVSYARWWHRALFARAPRIVAFRVREHVGGTLSGLSLSNTVEDIQSNAARMGILAEERFSVSPLVPRTISVRVGDAQELNQLARACRLDVQWFDFTALVRAFSRYEGMSRPPDHYEHVTNWSKWSLKGGEYPEVLVEHHMRRDRPDFWLASRDGNRVWFYDLNIARAWTAILIGEPPVIEVNEEFLQANHAFVPLPLARAVSVLGCGLPGPKDIRTYHYPVGTSGLRRFVLDAISQRFNLSRLTASINEQEQSTG